MRKRKHHYYDVMGPGAQHFSAARAEHTDALDRLIDGILFGRQETAPHMVKAQYYDHSNVDWVDRLLDWLFDAPVAENQSDPVNLLHRPEETFNDPI